MSQEMLLDVLERLPKGDAEWLFTKFLKHEQWIRKNQKDRYGKVITKADPVMTVLRDYFVKTVHDAEHDETMQIVQRLSYHRGKVVNTALIYMDAENIEVENIDRENGGREWKKIEDLISEEELKKLDRVLSVDELNSCTISDFKKAVRRMGPVEIQPIPKGYKEHIIEVFEKYINEHPPKEGDYYTIDDGEKKDLDESRYGYNNIPYYERNIQFTELTEPGKKTIDPTGEVYRAFRLRRAGSNGVQFCCKVEGPYAECAELGYLVDMLTGWRGDEKEPVGFLSLTNKRLAFDDTFYFPYVFEFNRERSGKTQKRNIHLSVGYEDLKEQITNEMTTFVRNRYKSEEEKYVWEKCNLTDYGKILERQAELVTKLIEFEKKDIELYYALLEAGVNPELEDAISYMIREKLDIIQTYIRPIYTKDDSIDEGYGLYRVTPDNDFHIKLIRERCDLMLDGIKATIRECTERQRPEADRYLQKMPEIAKKVVRETIGHDLPNNDVVAERASKFLNIRMNERER